MDTIPAQETVAKVHGELAPSIVGEIIALLLILATFGLWIWSLIHCIRNQKLTDTNRIIGITLIVLLSLIGSFIYLFLPREESADSPS